LFQYRDEPRPDVGAAVDLEKRSLIVAANILAAPRGAPSNGNWTYASLSPRNPPRHSFSSIRFMHASFPPQSFGHRGPRFPQPDLFRTLLSPSSSARRSVGFVSFCVLRGWRGFGVCSRNTRLSALHAFQSRTGKDPHDRRSCPTPWDLPGGHDDPVWIELLRGRRSRPGAPPPRTAWQPPCGVILNSASIISSGPTRNLAGHSIGNRALSALEVFVFFVDPRPCAGVCV